MHLHQASRSGEYHVMVALFDAKTGARISDATVTGSVAAAGLAPVVKPLEAMVIAGASTYGNYFPMLGAGPFRIRVRILLQGATAPVDVEFEHRHR